MPETQPDTQPFDRGHVVWHDGLFGNGGRPWFVLSDDRHPFHGEEYLVVGITTTDRPASIPIADDSWVVGGLPRRSYVSPWFLTTVKHADVRRGVGMLDDETIETIIADVGTYVR